MNPAHPVLQNADILRIICESILSGPIPSLLVERHMELISFALVCRLISEVALDVLWTEFEHIEDLYCLFPMEILTTDPKGHKTFTRSTLTIEQWSRFDIYAGRIRQLRVSFEKTKNSKSESALCDVLIHHPRHSPLFPGLTRLRWFGKSSLVSKVKVILCHTLRDVHLIFEDTDDGEAAADFLRVLKSTCTNIQRFTCHYPSRHAPNPISLEIEDSLVSLIRNSPHLRSVSTPASPKVLDGLRRLPSLSSLSLDDVRWEDRRTRQALDLEEFQPLDTKAFSALEYLDITSELPSLHPMTEYFQEVEQSLKVSLTIYVSSDERPTKELIKDLHETLYPNMRTGLFRCHIWNRARRDRACEPWQSFSWLRSCRGLKELVLEGFCLDVNDSDLKEMVQVWPEMNSLHLSMPARSRNQSQITFRGLVHLSALRNLQEITVMLSPDSNIAPSMLVPELYPASPLTNIKMLGEFPPVLPLQVSLFMGKYFPKLKFILCDGPEERWDEVQAGMQFMQELAAATMTRYYPDAA